MDATADGPVVVEHLADRSIARVVGEVDAANVDRMEAELRSAARAGASLLVIDLSDVSYLDSAGIRALFVATREAGKRQIDVQVVVPPSSPLRRLLQLVGFTDSVAVFGSLEETAPRA